MTTYVLEANLHLKATILLRIIKYEPVLPQDGEYD